VDVKLPISFLGLSFSSFPRRSVRVVALVVSMSTRLVLYNKSTAQATFVDIWPWTWSDL